MRKFMLLVALLTIVLAGCRVESNVILNIEEDGSALIGAEVGFDEEFAALLEDSGASPDELFTDLPTFGDDVVAIERTEGDMTYVGVASNVADLSNFAENSTELETFSSFSYEFDDSGATLNAAVSAADVGEFGGDGLGDLGIDPSQLTDEFFSANVVVTMPGDVTEHNADAVRSDGTLVWKVPFTGSTQITAVSSFGTSAANWTLIILVGLLLIGVIAVVAALVMSRRQSQSAVDDAATSHAAAQEVEPLSTPPTEDVGDTTSAVDDTVVDETATVGSGLVDDVATRNTSDSADDKPAAGESDAGVDTDSEGEEPEPPNDQPEST